MNLAMTGVWAFANPFRPGPTEPLLSSLRGTTSLFYGVVKWCP